jgi:hypothetical protein
MSDDLIKPRGTTSSYKDSRGGANLLSHPVIGIVKNNIDPTRSGRVEVYINRLNNADQDNPAYWTPVSYMTPFFGYTQNTSTPDGEGKYKTNSHSYGFWAPPPDIGTEVICIFVNGDINFGYYIGCIPKPGLTHMVPAVGASAKIVPNEEESGSYGGATELPVTEYNDANKDKTKKSELTEQDRTVHSYQASRLFKQGLIKDPERGTITSSATRESPSNVYGMSTPGRPYYKGGYTDKSIEGAVKNEGTPDENFKIVGRQGGHSIVMDDGDLTGKNQLLRLRSGSGHMILMQDKAETMYIVHANGKTYIEMNKEGAIDIYSTNSVNIRTHGDFNVHAERDINMFAKRNFNLKAEKISVESDKDTQIRVGENFKQQTLKKHTVKVDDAMSFESKADSSFVSKATTYINGGPNINLNTGSSSVTPEEVKKFETKKHTDTLYDKKKGFTPAPNKIESINTRVPAHSPWTEANKGVDVKVNMGSDDNTPSKPSEATQAANNSVPDTPAAATTPANAAAVPQVSGPAAGADPNATGAVVSQCAVNAANTPNIPADACGAFNHTPNQLEQAGALKPGAGNLASTLMKSGVSPEQAMPSQLWTGANGMNNFKAFSQSISGQTDLQASLLQNASSQLIDGGILSGNESWTQTAGLIMATAAVGLPIVAGFMNSRSGASSNAVIDSDLTSPIGSVPELITSGNYAAAMADQTSSGINPNISSQKTLTGSSAAAFDSLVAASVPLRAGIPQDLAQIKKEELASAATKNGVNITQTESAEPTAVTNTIGTLPGGESAISNIVNLSSVSQPIRLSDEIEALADQALGTPTTFNTFDVRNRLESGATNLESIAFMGLSSSESAGVSSAVNSITSGSATGSKVPTVAINTFDDTQLNSQMDKLLDSSYSSSPTTSVTRPVATSNNVSTQPVNATTSASASNLVVDLQSKSNSARDRYNSLKLSSGANSPDTVTAFNEYKESMKALSRAEDELNNLNR